MKKHLKYLISLFLVFGLAVNDCTLYSQSNSAAYYQYSNVILSKELNNKHSKLYVFNQTKTAEKTFFSFLFTYLQIQDAYTPGIPVHIKKQALLYQKVSSFAAQHTFLKELITSKNALSTLYIA